MRNPMIREILSQPRVRGGLSHPAHTQHLIIFGCPTGANIRNDSSVWRRDREPGEDRAAHYRAEINGPGQHRAQKEQAQIQSLGGWPDPRLLVVWPG